MIQIVVQVAPLRIRRLDQLDLPCSLPRLEHFLSSDRVIDRLVRLGENQSGQIVPAAEARSLAASMLPDARGNVAGDADIGSVLPVLKRRDLPDSRTGKEGRAG